MTQSFIISARRSAVVPQNGAFSGMSISDLAAPVMERLLLDAGLEKAQVGELILSNALGAGGNPARIAALAAGLPETVAGLSIDRQCVGGLDAILIAGAMVRAGLHDVVIAGGAESYSRQPLRYKTFADGRVPARYDQAPFTPWPDRDPDMAVAADALAQDQNISKADQDQWAQDSHHKAMIHGPAHHIVALNGVTRDPFTRNLSPALCARAAPVHGTVTPANMAVAADGAAFVLVVSHRVLQRIHGQHLEILSGMTIGGDPTCPGLAPVAAIQSTLKQANITADDVTRAEIMEAFAVQAIACQRHSNLPEHCVNPCGGALARGHPIGASGAVLAVDLFHGLEGGETGLAAIAAAGGLGTAALFRAG